MSVGRDPDLEYVPSNNRAWWKKPYPLVNIQKAIEHGPVEIVDFPLKMMIFHSYVSLPKGNIGDTLW